MANQFNRLAYALGKGGFVRLLFKSSVSATTMNLIVLPHAVCAVENDPNLEDMTEGDSYGRYFAPTLEMNSIRVDLRRRQDPVSLDALGVRGISFVDAVFVDIGTTGTGDLYWHMGVGPYSRGGPQSSKIEEGFTLMGGSRVGSGIALPTYMQASGTIPLLTGYVRTGVSVPSGL